MKRHPLILIGVLALSTSKTVDQAPYSWDVDFDLTLPAKGAAAGPGCGD